MTVSIGCRCIQDKCILGIVATPHSEVGALINIFKYFDETRYTLQTSFRGTTGKHEGKKL